MTDVKVPGIGPVNQKKALAVGGGIIVLAYLWYRRQANNASTANATPVDATAQDASNIAAGGGTNGTYDAFGGAATPTPTYNGQSYVTTPTNNADWTLQALQQLQSVGFDAIGASVALGKYLARQPLTSAEQDMVRTAISMTGMPPIGVFEIVTSSAPTTTTTTPGSPATGVGIKHKYAVEFHRVGTLHGANVNARSYVQTHSDSQVATPNNVQTALTATVNDLRNVKVRAFYGSHGGTWPGGAAIYLHVVKVA